MKRSDCGFLSKRCKKLKISAERNRVDLWHFDVQLLPEVSYAPKSEPREKRVRRHAGI